LLEHLFADVEAFVRADGAVAVAIVLLFECLGAPLPGESMLIFSGFMAARGELSMWALLPAAWLGSTLGGAVGYLIGRLVGRTAILRWGGRVGLTAERWGRVEATFSTYGPVAVVFARFFNILRQLNGVVAGATGLPWWSFMAANAVGAAMWTTFWAGGTYLFGGAIAGHVGSLEKAGEAMMHSPAAWAGLALFLAATAVVVVLWRRRGAARGA
jgi:membrane protein DedA with SNARE-associated domain